MRIDCEQCGAAYSIDDALISERGVRAQCPKCGHQKVVKKPSATATSGGAETSNPFGAPPGNNNPFGAPSSSSANPFAAPSASPSAANPFAPPSSPNPFGGGAGGGNPFGAPPSSSAPPLASPFGAPPSSSAPPLASPFSAPPSPSSFGNPSAAAGPNPFQPPSFGAEPTLAGGAPSFLTQPTASANPFGASQLPTQPSGAPVMSGANPFGGSASQMPTQPSGNPFGAPPSSSPSSNPFGAPVAGAAGGAAGNNPFGGSAGAPPPNPFGGAPGSAGGGGNPFSGPSSDPFAASLGAPGGAAPSGAGGDPFSGGAFSGGPPSGGAPDAFSALAPPAAGGGIGMNAGSDAFGKLDIKLQASTARPPMSAPGGMPGANAVVAHPGDNRAALADPFANLGISGGGAATGGDAFDRGGLRPVDDPFAKLDLGGSSSSSAAAASPSRSLDHAPAAQARWHVRTKAGMDADVDLAQLRDLVRQKKVAFDDEAAPLGEPLQAVSAWPLLAPPPPVARQGARVSGVGARAAPSFGRIAAVLAVVLVVAVAAGVYLVKPEIFERTTDAGVNPLRRAKASWEKQFPDVNGSASEHVNAGKAQMHLDTAAGYRKADEELRQALLLDIGNTTAMSLWVENFTNLPAVKADQEGAALAAEAIAYALKKEPENVDVMRAAGALKLARGDVDGAQKILLAAHAQNPANLDTTLVLAASHLERNPQDALDLVQEVVAKDSTLKHALVIEGAAERRLGDYKEARDVLGARLADDPSNTGALKERAKLELDVGNAEAAISDLSKLLEAEDRDVEAHLMRAKIAYQSLDTADALKRADGFLDIVIKEHDQGAGELLVPVLSHAAYVKAELGDLDNALKLAERAKATNPQFAPALFVLGRIQALKGDLDDAKKNLEAAVTAAKQSSQDSFYEPVCRAELARVLAASGDAANAIRNYEQVIEYDPRYTRAHFGLAAAYMSTDKATQAMTIVRRAFDNDPNYAAERRELTDYPTPKRDLVAFADTFKKATVPSSDESLSSLKLAAEGMIRYAAGDVAGAEALEKRTLSEDRFSDVALLYLGVIELGDGRNQDAKRHLRAAVESTGKNHSITRMYLARAEMRTGELEAAKKRLQDLIDQEPTLVQAQYSHAMLLRQQHLESQASAELKKILKADPDYTPAKRALADAP